MFTGDAALVSLINSNTALIEAGKYKELAEAHKSFLAEHPTTSYMASEPLPFKVGAHLSKKFGSSATTTFTLRNSTWASDLTKALNEGPEAFAALAAKFEAQVADIAKAVKPLS